MADEDRWASMQKLSRIRYATYAVLLAIFLLQLSSRRRVVPVDLYGTDFPEIRAFDMRDHRLPQLSDIQAFPALYRGAVLDVGAAVKQEGLVPEDYAVEIRPVDVGRILRFSLWHRSVIGANYDPQVRGDPSGKCRTVVYDSITGKVIKIHGWR